MADEVWRIRVEAESNLAQLQQDILEAKRAAASLGTRYSRSDKLADQEALQAQRAVLELAKAQERAALSGMSHAEKLKYFQAEVNGTKRNTLEYYNALTNLNNEKQRGIQVADLFARQLARIAIGLAVWTTLRGVQQIIQEQIAAVREYSLEVARFAAITGQSVGEATRVWDEYAKIAGRAGVKPMEAAPVARIAELTSGETDQTRQQFVRTVTQLEELTGVSSEKIGKGLSSALQQAGKGLEYVDHMGNLVAITLSRIRAANVEGVIQALQEAAPLAQLWGTSFDEAFNIIVEGAARAQESPEQIATSFQRLSKGLNDIAQGGSDAWERQSKLASEFGLKVNDVYGQLRPIPDILGQIAQMLPDLSAPRQQALLETVAGGSLRPEQTRNILGAIQAFNADLSGSVDNLGGTLDRMTDVIDKSLGQSVKVLDAKIAQLREKGDILSNIAVSLVRSTVGEYGGRRGLEAVQGFMDFSRAGQLGQEAKQPFIQDIIAKAGGDQQRAVQLAAEQRKSVLDAFNKQTSLNPVEWFAARNYAVMLQVTDEEIVRAMAQGTQKIQEASTERAAAIKAGPLTPLLPQFQQAGSRTDPLTQRIAAAAARPEPVSPLSEFAQKIKTTMVSQGGSLTGEDFFPNMGAVNAQFDATKMTMDEINQARRQSVELVQQELDMHRAFLEAQGLEKTEIDAIIKMEKERLDLSYLQVRAKEKLLGLTGAEAARFQQAASDMAEERQRAQSNFQFQRLRNVDPSQFGQLQALTQMYDQFLTNIGSPEKKMNINLLMGEQNVFKTMNARMTALQLALEDLTKVEKAQLSGTWNLPAGATALVPISSLDIQRWNKSGGGGLSEEAIRALLGATNQSGDQVSESMQTAATRIIAAIQEEAMKSGIMTEKIAEAKTIPEAIDATREGLQSRVSAALAMRDQALAAMRRSLDMRPLAQDYEDAAERDMRLRRLSSDSRTMNDVLKVQAPQVTVSALPVKATFNASVSVVLNGAIVARTIIPILYDLITKMTASTGTRPKGTQR